jgi:hypothetical protein
MRGAGTTIICKVKHNMLKKNKKKIKKELELQFQLPTACHIEKLNQNSEFSDARYI